MPKYPGLNKILVIGSGPIIIGQGCEFDYSGTQACKALREEGCEIVLLNSNPASVMTDSSMADATYIVPMTLETLKKIILKERPDAVLPTLGGQTALNLSIELFKSGILATHGIRLIGASVEAIEKAENRKLFREAMKLIGLDTPLGYTASNIQDVLLIEKKLKFPIIVRTSFTLGGHGSGIATTSAELYNMCQYLFSVCDFMKIELEESLLGWKEFEMEAIRDCADNCIIVCSLENVDPMGVHTGDSITVAPALTLCNKQYQKMRQATFSVLREIGVNTGGANVQFAVHPETGRMVVIEMNPRVSRSSALASKATGYPIAKIATQLALGYTLDELDNMLTAEKIPASFEPSIDYVVTKLPCFNFEKFPHCDGILTTTMQSTGEVIGIGRNFQESLQKALCSMEKNFSGLSLKITLRGNALEKISKSYHDRLFYIAESFRQGLTINEVYQKTRIDRWFLEQIFELIYLEKFIINTDFSNISKEKWIGLKRQGFSDRYLAELLQCDESIIRKKRKALGIFPVYKRVDSCAAEFSARSACLYSTYEEECEALPTENKKILIIGSGPNRIGQGLEFDYASVHAAIASRECGYETIMVNSNPETVSTDYDIVDRLYLEPLTLEHILNIIDVEKPTGVITHFGGQTALNLVSELYKANVPLLGTSANAIDRCENRDLFQKIVTQLGLLQPENFCIHHIDEWHRYAEKIQYPVIIRPSYLLSGSSMQIIKNKEEYLAYANLLENDKKYFPVLVERFLENAIEVEIDGICDGKDVFIPGVIEQLEPAGIHSGDSVCCFPAHTLPDTVQQKIIQKATQLARHCEIRGLFNAQFVIQKEQIFIIEINPRSSRTIPFLSKALGISLPQIATRCILGLSLREQGYFRPIKTHYFSIKIPVFPFDRLGGEKVLGPEMRSTGEQMRIKKDITSLRSGSIDSIGYDFISLQQMERCVK